MKQESVFCLLLFVGLINGHGYMVYPQSRPSVCFWGRSRIQEWPLDGSGMGDAACTGAFQDSLARGVSPTNQFHSRMSYVGRNNVPGRPGNRLNFHDGSLMPNTEVCSAGSQRGYRMGNNIDFRSQDRVLPWRKHEISASAPGSRSDVTFRFCATAPHHRHRWFIYHHAHDPHTTALRWDRLQFIAELGTQSLKTSPTPLENCFIHDTPHNQYYEITVPIPLVADGTIVTIMQTDAFYDWEYILGCHDYTTKVSEPPTRPPAPVEPCVQPTCVVGNDLVAPHRNPHWYFTCQAGVSRMVLCPTGTLFTINNRCANIPIPVRDRFECQDWSILYPQTEHDPDEL